jgi:hypothetical protein
MRIFSLIAVLALVFALGCGSQAENSDEAAATDHAAEAVADHAADAVADHGTDAQVAAVGDAVNLTGTAGCGHCTFGKGEGCAMAMQLNDVVYILDGIDEDTEAFNERLAGNQITVAGTLSDIGDPHHIAVESYEAH